MVFNSIFGIVLKGNAQEPPINEVDSNIVVDGYVVA